MGVRKVAQRIVGRNLHTGSVCKLSPVCRLGDTLSLTQFADRVSVCKSNDLKAQFADWLVAELACGGPGRRGGPAARSGRPILGGGRPLLVGGPPDFGRRAARFGAWAARSPLTADSTTYRPTGLLQTGSDVVADVRSRLPPTRCELSVPATSRQRPHAENGGTWRRHKPQADGGSSTRRTRQLSSDRSGR
jgi:hypothetical protein